MAAMEAILSLLWLLSCPIALAIACPVHERNYLLDFKAAVVDENNYLHSWQGFDCCGWEGVDCDSYTGYVTRLSLTNYNLNGRIHSSLFKLGQLEHLELSFTSFQGIPIPSGLTNLKRLTFLSLSYVDFKGQISANLVNLSNLTSLEYLYLDGAYISASAKWGEALGSLSDLRTLHMSDCGLRGLIPKSLLNLNSLLHLDLSFNALHSQIPTWFTNLTSHLLSFDLSYNELFGHIPSNLLHSAHLLQKLDLSRNQYLGGDLSFIGQHQSWSLGSMDISFSALEGQIPPAAANMTSLKRLILINNMVEGLIPPSMANMSQLQVLDLSNNRLTGLIPPFGYRLNFPLSYLDLSSNGLERNIPNSLGRLSMLKYLDLSFNKLNGSVPSSLGHLSHLEFLTLDRNHLSGTIPSTISELLSLRTLWLSSNSLRGTISLSFFDNLTRFEALDLSHNDLTVNISSTWIPQFEKLYYLGLASCNLAAFPSFLVNLYYMKHLDLSANRINTNIPSWIWNLPNLLNLILSSNRLTGMLPSRLTSEALRVIDLHNNSLQGALPLPPADVQVLDLSKNKFNSSIPSDIATYLGSTIFLSLSENNLSGGIPVSLCTRKMEVLVLSKNMLAHSIPPNFVKNCLGLSVLNLAENFLQGGLPELGNLRNLQTLNLNGNHLEGPISSSIAKCQALQVLDLGNNNLGGAIPKWIGNLSQLQILVLRSNKFKGNIPSELTGLQNLQILDLSHNKLSGPIPTGLTNLSAMVNQSQSSSMQVGFIVESGNPYTKQITVSMKGADLDFEEVLTILKCMDLSNNKLSGDIPPEMGFLQGLIALNLSRNFFSGRIPKEFGHMDRLESLDLSLNKLKGSIPLELQSLSYLQFLNLSYNMLEGNIPRGGQLLTFEESSFLGNADLHGFPFNNTSCNSSPKDDDSDNVGDEEAEDIEWWAVAVGLSYALSFSIVVGVLSFNKRVKKVVFDFYDAIIMAVLKY